MSKDPYKYFRIEAKELVEGLGRGVLALEQSGGAKEPVGHLLRLTHTLKGAARVVKQPTIAEAAHAMEELLAPLREGGATGADVADPLLRWIDRISAAIAALDAPAAQTPVAQPVATRAVAAPEAFESVRIELAEMDALLEGVAEVSVQLAALRREVVAAEHALRLADALAARLALPTSQPGGAARARELGEELRAHLARHERALASGLEQTGAEFALVRDAASQLRLMPAASVFAMLERAARDTAHALGKQVAVQTRGGDIRLDARVLATVRGALLQAVRNAVAHGIEAPARRASVGKPELGRIAIAVERRAGRAVFTCEDDGAGIDADAVRKAARAQGLLDAGASPSTEELLELLLRGGVSTRGAVDEVAGRGVGLDVVREAAAQLKGEVVLRSEPGRGTTLELRVPLSLASLRAITVDAAGITVSLPLDAVSETLRISERDIARAAEHDTIVHAGKVIPFLSLARALGRPEQARVAQRSVLVLAAAGGTAALGVDRLVGTSEIVLRALPALTAADPIVAGTSFDAEGNPQLVLDPEGLVASALRSRPEAIAATPTRLPLLVIDDSLTTRMLEQAILESAGYEVDLASSGEEGLEKARARRYGLILVDVEMPGIDGFELVTQVKADARLRDVPAILVTSRDAAEDRRRGLAAGAHAYVVKGEFDQGRLLQIIAGLVG